MNSKSRIRALALAAGFNVVGFTRAALPASAREGLTKYLALGHHGDMGWMESRAELRGSPELLWPEAKTVIVLGQNYAPAENPLLFVYPPPLGGGVGRGMRQTDPLLNPLPEGRGDPQRGVISAYAQGDDYHDVIKKKLKALAHAIARELGGDARVYVDTAPVMEKPLAQAAGLGWQGKHTCIVSREFGSWLFLGEIFISLELEADAAETDSCGTCTRCLDICPTNAFTAPHELDARRCISYLTIEHKTHIPLEFRKPIGNRIYGCDDCLAVCPWNKFAQASTESAYHPREALTAPLLSELVTLDDASFRELFRKSPIKRIGRDRFLRNVLIALGNSGDASHVSAVIPLLADPSPLVRGAAIWALSELADMVEFAKIRDAHLPAETDGIVAQEWKREAA